MGQKINPDSLRTGISKDWSSRWFFTSSSHASNVKQNIAAPGKRGVYARILEEDEAVRNVIQEKIGHAGIATVEIERTANDLNVLIKTARPGLVIGRGGSGIEELTQAIEKKLEKIRGNTASKTRLRVNVEELKRRDASSAYTAQQIAWNLEGRMPYRRTMKKYLDQLLQNSEVKGVKIRLAGRLGGADIARAEVLKKGSLPLQTLRANIDYGTATANTTYGSVGIKVWVYKGESPIDSRVQGASQNTKR